jgi:Holliday junction resolvase
LEEAKIQKKIIKHLEDKGFYVVKLMKTNKNGIPDLLAMREDKFSLIEVKAPNGIVSSLQKYRMEELKEHGLDVILAYSVNDVNHL